VTTAQASPPDWPHHPITAEQFDSWSEEQCQDIEIVDGMVVRSPSPSARHNRVGNMLAVALEHAAGEGWQASTDFDVRLQDVPLINRRPDVVVYRAEAADASPMRPENILMIVEIVSPGSETTDRKVTPDEYAGAGIAYYWRVEQVAHGIPVVHTYVLDPAAHMYRATDVFPGVVKTVAPFPIEIDLTKL
jgi:Uma2 family endonuclease